MQTSDQVIESIKQLPSIEQEKIRHWLDDKRTPLRSNGNWQGRIEKFNAAMRWIEENSEQYLGKWVCLDGDKLISFGDDAKTVFAEARAFGIEIPFIEQITKRDNSPYWGGWD